MEINERPSEKQQQVVSAFIPNPSVADEEFKSTRLSLEDMAQLYQCDEEAK